MPHPALTCRADVLAMFRDLTRQRRQVYDRVGAFSRDQLLDPVYPHTWPILKILAHTGFSEGYLMAVVRSRPHAPEPDSYAPEPPLEFTPIRVALDEAHAEAISFLKAYPESVLQEPVSFGRPGSGETVGGVFFQMIEHEIRHRSFILHKMEVLTVRRRA